MPLLMPRLSFRVDLTGVEVLQPNAPTHRPTAAIVSSAKATRFLLRRVQRAEKKGF
ncbi:hypothetical protein I3842_01G095000 [Carya illinoinensis]|uniref:Uncharacterized protein n=1 Tax=Carya illinoinensis TaxID=32201 RepID=A0A922FX51_CARIL|nr:hypothetical protein I3842_01G095000 [Carya illinoinensis]